MLSLQLPQGQAEDSLGELQEFLLLQVVLIQVSAEQPDDLSHEGRQGCTSVTKAQGHQHLTDLVSALKCTENQQFL